MEKNTLPAAAKSLEVISPRVSRRGRHFANGHDVIIYPDLVVARTVVFRNHRGPVWRADTTLTTRIKLTRLPSDMAGNNIQPREDKAQRTNLRYRPYIHCNLSKAIFGTYLFS